MSLLDDVSIVVTPNGYKAGELYAVIPSDGAADMDVTRATDATRVDENGLVEKLGANVPRIDYTGGGCPHILAEPQRTNLVTYSEDFTQSYWSPSNTAVTANATISPDGTTNATLLVGASQSATGTYIRATTTSASVIGTTYTLSLYVKPKGSSKFLKFWARNTDAAIAIFNLVDGTTDTPLTSTITAVDNGWFRVTTTGELLSATVAPYFYTYYSATENEGFYFWGAEIEEGSYSTSYIPTTGSTVTRNQDIFTRDGIGSLINSTEGVLFVEMAALDNDGSYRVMTISDGTTANYIALYYSPTTNNISWELKVGGAAQFSRSVSLPLGSKSFNKFAFKYKENDCKLFLNGVESDIYTSNATFTSNTLNSLFLTNGLGSLKLFGKVKQLQVYDTALTDDQLRQITQ